jgi:NAD(P)-dependent dehydrogenase (short-subunit alcohol dehydrogenase family)
VADVGEQAAGAETGRRTMSDLRFDKQVVIITGAGRGMGRAHARLLAERGATVVVNDLGCDMSGNGAKTGPAHSVAEEIIAAGGTALASTEDISTVEGCRNLVAQTLERFGHLDTIVHNAGICYRTPLPRIATADLDANFDVHYRAGIRLTQEAWPHFVDQGGGRLLYIVSEAGIFGNETFAHYGSAKMALVGLMRTAHLEGASQGIRANALAVGARTRMAGVLPDEVVAWFDRYMPPEAVSPTVAWLIHPDCPASGEIYEAIGYHIARVAIVLSSGYTNFQLTPEDVRDNFRKISDLTEYTVPRSTSEALAHNAEQMEKAGADPLPL